MKKYNIFKIIFYLFVIFLIPCSINLDYYPSKIKFYNITIKIQNGYKIKFVTAKSVYMYPGVYNYILYSKLFLEKKANHKNITIHIINKKGNYITLIFKNSIQEFKDNKQTIEIIKNKDDKIYTMRLIRKKCVYKNIILFSNSYNTLNLFAKNIKCNNKN